MKTRKQEYIDRIRSDSSYPTYRTFVRILTRFGYVLAGIIVLVGGISYITGEPLPGRIGFLIGSIIIGAITAFASRLWMEAALILADIADSITDANSKSSYER